MKRRREIPFIFVAEKIFKPIYPAIARDIIRTTNIREGVCLEIGSGTAALSRSLARLTNLRIIALDYSRSVCKISKRYIEDDKLEIAVVNGEVENLPFSSSSINLVVSRGSIFFWRNKVKALLEIIRVLNSGGIAYIGGGFGNAKLKRYIEKRMKQMKPTWRVDNRKRMQKVNFDAICSMVENQGVNSCRIVRRTGIWMLVKK